MRLLDKYFFSYTIMSVHVFSLHSKPKFLFVHKHSRLEFLLGLTQTIQVKFSHMVAGEEVVFVQSLHQFF